MVPAVTAEDVVRVIREGADTRDAIVGALGVRVDDWHLVRVLADLSFGGRLRVTDTGERKPNGAFVWRYTVTGPTA